MKLLHGNCLELLPELEPNSVDLVFGDLPYGQTYCKWDTKIDLSEMWKEVKRVIKPTTPIFFTCSTKFGYELIKSNEKWFRYDLVWEKSSLCGFLNAKQMPMRGHEMIYVFYEKLPLYDIGGHSREQVGIHPVRRRGVESPYNNCKSGAIQYQYNPPLPTSILKFRSEKEKHQTQKPTTLMSWIFKYYSKEDDVVLDPTMGSGSMGKACKDMNRYFIGIEMDQEIYNTAVERLEYQTANS